MSLITGLTGPWADWDRPLEGQDVYLPVEQYPFQRQATRELRALLREADEDHLAPGRGAKKSVLVCSGGCEGPCDEVEHATLCLVWAYKPYVKPPRPPRGAKSIMRCSTCRLLCITSGRTRKPYAHLTWNGSLGRLDHCPGSGLVALDPKTTKRDPHTPHTPTPTP